MFVSLMKWTLTLIDSLFIIFLLTLKTTDLDLYRKQKANRQRETVDKDPPQK